MTSEPLEGIVMVDMAAPTLVFDGTEDPDLIPFDVWVAWRDHYWVIAYVHRPPPVDRHDSYAVKPWDWCLSPGEPRPVPNSQMAWRRPTYGEALERWRFALDEPEVMARLQAQRSQAKYARLKGDG